MGSEVYGTRLNTAFRTAGAAFGLDVGDSDSDDDAGDEGASNDGGDGDGDSETPPATEGDDQPPVDGSGAPTEPVDNEVGCLHSDGRLGCPRTRVNQLERFFFFFYGR